MGYEKFKMPGSKESFFDKLSREMKNRGFSFAGQEALTTIKLDPGDGKFKAIETCTEEDIRLKYKDRGEVELVERDDLDHGQKAVWVFIKEKD